MMKVTPFICPNNLLTENRLFMSIWRKLQINWAIVSDKAHRMPPVPPPKPVKCTRKVIIEFLDVDHRILKHWSLNIEILIIEYWGIEMIQIIGLISRRWSVCPLNNILQNDHLLGPQFNHWLNNNESIVSLTLCWLKWKSYITYQRS